MLKLRKVLLCDYIYYIFLIIVILLTIFRLNIKSIYSSPYTGIVTKIVKIDDRTTININNKVIASTISIFE